MIALSHQKGWKIISQRSHGLLAAMIANQYDIDLPGEILMPTLLAIAEHDDGVTEMLAEQNLTDAGAPRCFTVKDKQTNTDLEPLYNLMEIANSKSELNGLLASLHIKFLYDGDNRKSDKPLDRFLTKQEHYRKDVLKNLKITKAFSEKLYRFLEWCDAFSLLFCLDKFQSQGRKMEISKSPDGDMNTVHRKPNEELCVEPWPFKINSFQVFYEYKVVEQLQFKSVEEFNEIWKSAKIERETFTVSK